MSDQNIWWHHLWCSFYYLYIKAKLIVFNINNHLESKDMIKTDYDYLFKFILVGDSSNSSFI